MTVKEFIILSGVTSNVEEVRLKMKELKKPFSINSVRTPDSLNDITIGTLIELQSISTELDYILVPSRLLLGLKDKSILNEKVDRVLGFSLWVSEEVKRINKLFEGTNTEPTPEEKRAGIESLNFGLFGMLDYYAIRMGITDHEEVEKVPWLRVYKCLDMDAKKVKYERRLQTILRNNDGRK